MVTLNNKTTLIDKSSELTRPFVQSDSNIVRCEFASQNALIFYFDGETLLHKNKSVTAFHHNILQAGYLWLLESIPAFDSCLIEFDDLLVDHHSVIDTLVNQSKGEDVTKVNAAKIATADSNTTNRDTSKHHILPVWYDRDPNKTDLLRIASQTNMPAEEVIRLHIIQHYRVYAVGFQPGFAYLGELDKTLFLPRMSVPRTKVPKGAVAIAQGNTAVYPNSSPGGWHIVGLCPLDLHAKALSHSAFVTGDSVEFVQIDEAKYKQLLEF